VGLLNADDELSNILAYHARSKHRLDRYAAGPSGLDWDDQPEPFRWFSGAPRFELPFTADGVTIPYNRLSTAQAIAPRSLDLDGLSALLERSLGLAAWKQYGQDRWALRCNPSSGNLHPTEAYVVTAGLAGLPAGVFHYLSRDHVLEQRCAPEAGVLSARLPAQSLLVGLSSIHWREAWKYGERAYRYCQLDAGHAIAALRYAAAALGWSLRQLDTWGDADIAGLLGLARGQDFDGVEREVPDVMLLVQAGGQAAEPSPDDLIDIVRTAPWQGSANRLSEAHFESWPVIDEVSAACSKPRTPPDVAQAAPLPPPLDSACEVPAMTLFRRRRSAQRFDAATAISAAQFFRMLDMLLPRDGLAPWDSLPGEPRIHPVFFVHRVEGLRPGLYVMPRRSGADALLRAGLQREAFEWRPVEACPAHIPLASLVLAKSQRVAATLSCHQAIAADSAFAVAMLAEFEDTLVPAPWAYRQLYREAGVLGQVLYLEAEAAGVQGTGIGCFFDDPVHELLGIEDRLLQSLYHFTVGGAVIDHRLTILPPYPQAGERNCTPA
jgi:SagB-type dehydrogenase family enzyme